MATKKSQSKPEPETTRELVPTSEGEGKIATALGNKWLASGVTFAAAWEEHRIDTINLAQFLFSQKQKLPSLQEFGRFCTRYIPQINHNDRAALVYMGEHLAETREVLEKTKRKSPQHICAQEIRPLVEAKALALSSGEDNGDTTNEDTDPVRGELVETDALAQSHSSTNTPTPPILISKGSAPDGSLTSTEQEEREHLVKQSAKAKGMSKGTPKDKPSHSNSGSDSTPSAAATPAPHNNNNAEVAKPDPTLIEELTEFAEYVQWFKECSRELSPYANPPVAPEKLLAVKTLTQTIIGELAEIEDSVKECEEGAHDEDKRKPSEYTISFRVTGTNIKTVRKAVVSAFPSVTDVEVERKQYLSRDGEFQMAHGLVDNAVEILDGLKDGLEQWRDNRPESFQGDEKEGQLDMCIDALETLHDELEAIDWDSVEFPDMMG
jgi:hypothetical protein